MSPRSKVRAPSSGDRLIQKLADDAVDAILHGLEQEHLNSLERKRFSGMGEWGIYNLAADVPDNRYSLLKIQSDNYGFFPREDFAAWREV